MASRQPYALHQHASPAAVAVAVAPAAGPAARIDVSSAPSQWDLFKPFELNSGGRGPRVPSRADRARAARFKTGRAGGYSCHHCKVPKPCEALRFCGNNVRGLDDVLPGEKSCGVKFCVKCLRKHYGLVVLENEERSWECPRCAGVCFCAACQLKKKYNGGQKAAQQKRSPCTGPQSPRKPRGVACSSSKPAAAAALSLSASAMESRSSLFPQQQHEQPSRTVCVPSPKFEGLEPLPSFEPAAHRHTPAMDDAEFQESMEAIFDLGAAEQTPVGRFLGALVGSLEAEGLVQPIMDSQGIDDDEKSSHLASLICSHANDPLIVDALDEHVAQMSASLCPFEGSSSGGAAEEEISLEDLDHAGFGFDHGLQRHGSWIFD